MKDVFVSYATPDKDAADRITAFLEDRDISVWIAPRDVPPGSNYGDEIITGIEAARALVLVLSGETLDSVYVSKEVERAVSKGKPVFPVRIRDVQVSGSLEFFISSAQWIDAFQSPLENHLLPLVQAVKGEAPAARPMPAAAEPKKTRPWQLPLLAALAIGVAGIGAFVVFKPKPADGAFYVGHWCEVIGPYVVRWEVLDLTENWVQTRMHHPRAPVSNLPKGKVTPTSAGLRLDYEPTGKRLMEAQEFTVLDSDTIRRDSPDPGDQTNGVRKRCAEGDESG